MSSTTTIIDAVATALGMGPMAGMAVIVSATNTSKSEAITSDFRVITTTDLEVPMAIRIIIECQEQVLRSATIAVEVHYSMFQVAMQVALHLGRAPELVPS